MRKAGAATAKRFYAIGINLGERPVVVVGGGKVGERKVRHLLTHRAAVRLVSPDATPHLQRLAGGESIIWIRRRARAADLRGAALVMLAGDDPAAMDRLAAVARRLGIPVNRADKPEDCDFIVAGSFEAGPVTVGVFTGGLAPAFTRWLKRRLETEVGPAMGQMAVLVGEAREWLQTQPLRQPQRARILSALMSSELYEVLKSKGLNAARRRKDAFLRAEVRRAVRHSEP